MTIIFPLVIKIIISVKWIIRLSGGGHALEKRYQDHKARMTITSIRIKVFTATRQVVRNGSYIEFPPNFSKS